MTEKVIKMYKYNGGYTIITEDNVKIVFPNLQTVFEYLLDKFEGISSWNKEVAKEQGID